MKSIFASKNGIILITFFSISFISCGSYKNYVSIPKVPVTYNYYEYNIRILDEQGKVNNEELTVYYKDFDIEYTIDSNLIMSFSITNKSNNSLIIDKSKCFVLYDGYATQLFKDVRAGRMTTYGNVQDAINSVSTNESSVTMSIPPYSKWAIPINETNLKAIKIPTKFEWKEGNHSLPQYTTDNTVEFVIPYTYDYSLAQWSTSRNRLYYSNIKVEKVLGFYSQTLQRGVIDGKPYKSDIAESDLIEYRRVNALNDDIRVHNQRIANRKGNGKILAGVTFCIFSVFGTAALVIYAIGESL